MKRGESVFAVILGCVFLALVLWMVVGALATIGYSSTKGRALSSETKSTVGGRGRSYTPVIKYSYTVAGTEQIGGTYTAVLMDRSGTIEWAREVLSRYPPGSECIVYYDADDPAKSVLRRAPSGKFHVLAIGMAFLGSVSVLAGAMSLRRKDV